MEKKIWEKFRRGPLFFLDFFWGRIQLNSLQSPFPGIHLTQYVNCTAFCEDELSFVNGEREPDLVLIYLLYLHSLASELQERRLDERVLASIAAFDLTPQELDSLDLSPAELANMRLSSQSFHDSDFIPFRDFARFMSRKKQTGILAELLSHYLNDQL